MYIQPATTEPRDATTVSNAVMLQPAFAARQSEHTAAPTDNAAATVLSYTVNGTGIQHIQFIGQ